MSFLSPRIDLFKFTERYSGRVYRLTNNNRPAYIGLEEYTPAAITRTEVIHSEELSKTTQKITLPLTNEMARSWIFGATEEEISVVLFSQKGSDTKGLWRGRLTRTVPESTTIILEFDDIYSSMNKVGLSMSYTRSCRHNLYSAQCGIKPEDYRVPAAVSSFDGEVLTMVGADSKPDGYFSGGFLQTSVGSKHLIVSHKGNKLTMLQPILFFQKASNSREVSLYPGCNKTTQMCQGRYNNLPRHGGFPWIPGKGIYDGNPITGV